MISIKERIQQFNNNIKDEYYHLTCSGQASEKELKAIAPYFDFPIPLSLTWFYRETGSVTGDSEEFVLNIEPVSYLLEKLQEKEKYYLCRSLGIIDYIRFSWGNDRPEFDEIQKSKIDFLNNNYKSIGHYRYDWGLEEAYYLYVDKKGNFGEVRYHQDDFYNLWKENLNGMLKESPAKEELEGMLMRIINKLETGIKEKDD